VAILYTILTLTVTLTRGLILHNADDDDADLLIISPVLIVPVWNLARIGHI